MRREFRTRSASIPNSSIQPGCFCRAGTVEERNLPAGNGWKVGDRSSPTSQPGCGHGCLASGADLSRALFRLEGSVQNISHFGLRLILVQGMICSFFPSPGEFPRGKISSIRWRAPSNFPDASCSCRFSCPSGNRQCVSAERLPIARRRSRRGRHQLRGSDDEFRG